MRLKILFSIVCCCMVIQHTQAQITITGAVMDQASNEPLVGATVRETGGINGAVTDANGKYTLPVASENAVIQVTYVGYLTQELTVGKSSVLNFRMMIENASLEEVVVTGYGTQRKVDLTGAVSIVNTKMLKNSPNPNPIKALQGQVPGVSIQTDGNPAGGATVRIRGVSTLNNNDPLYIIDGVPTKSSAFNILNSNDIESIQVLKDGASAAIYGSRASNGVIIVTTKQAKSEGFQINYSSAFTHSRYISMPKMLNTMERARVHWQATINDGGNPDNIPFIDYDWSRDASGKAVLNNINIPEYLIPGVKSANTDWFKAISRTGFIQEHNLSLSASGKNTGSVISFRFYDDKYVLHAKNNKRYSTRINTRQDFFDKKVRIGQNLSVSNVMDNGFSGLLPLERALSVRPILPVLTDDGNYSGPITGAFTDDENPYMVLDINNWDQRNNVNVFGNVYADISLAKNLNFKSTFGIDWQKGLDRDIERIFDTGIKKRLMNSVRNLNSENFNWVLNATVDYNLLKGKHNTTVLVGTEAIKNNYRQSSSYRENFALETFDYFTEDAGSGRHIVSGSSSGYSLLSYFGKVNYAYADKYLFSATGRYDGSSRFGENNRFGFFPSLSAGWRIDQEDFLKNAATPISELKLRGSWGITGNQEISNTARFTTYMTHYGESAIAFNSDNGTAYDIYGADSGSLLSGFRKSQTGNNNLKWEQSGQMNAGIDLGFFANKLTGSLDLFVKNTKDILISPLYLAAIGEGGNRYVNGASMQTKGFEILLGYQDAISKLNYSVTGNLGHYRDKITELPKVVLNSYPGNVEQNILGRSMNSIFGYVTDGIFKNQEEVDQHAIQPGKGIGRLKYKDLNDDGTINTLDQRYLGISTPRYEYGINLNLSYKNFDFTAFFQGVFGREVNNVFKRRTDFSSLWAGINYGKRTLDAWSPDNPGSTIPAVTLVDNNNEGRLSTYFIENGAYMKLRQISLGYNLPDIKYIRSSRLYLTADNLLTFKHSSFTSEDPENPGNGFPRPRNITLGLSINL
ncbi:SusC/RagA family TonB-linked outer membrane protein [Dyadobacter bucti]|uniref:SusC/RagA family TonB-linked outer membrane protein n=1 Tax=Dyadobacter bucti TaxID=2572203 RepID=UPI003F711749